MESHFGTGGFWAEVRIPVQRPILDAIARTLWIEAQRATDEIELVRFPQCAFIQFHDD